MTTVSIGGGFRLAVSPKKAWPESPPFLSQSTAIILPKSSKSCVLAARSGRKSSIWKRQWTWIRMIGELFLGLVQSAA